jgi:hypothetical protein
MKNILAPRDRKHAGVSYITRKNATHSQECPVFQMRQKGICDKIV